VEDTTPDEGQLVERARRGDTAAFSEIVRRYQELAFRTAFLITGNAPDSEDATQEAMVKAFYALPRFRRGAPLRPWLLQIVGNEARNRRRSAGRRRLLALRAAETNGGPSVEDTHSPEAHALEGEQRAALLLAVNQLRLEDRTVIACRYFLDLSEEEISRALGCARGTVKSRLSRALRRLRDALAGDPTAGGVEAAENKEVAHG
jgi:RNA polymerase sigma factor (sigma-70 family)